MTTQLVVIGAGPGGYAAAFFAADLGMQVTLVDRELNPGGVCLYRGCIPSKALLHVAKVAAEAKHAEAWGLKYAAPTIDLDKVRAFKDSVVAKLTGGVGQLSKMRKVNYLRGTATFVDGKTLSVELVDGGKTETVSFEHAIIATGSHPTPVPGISIDSPLVMDSTGALDLPDIPKSLLVVGGGYIGLELGSVYAALGTEVTVVEMTDGLLPGADRDLVNILAKRLETTLHKIRLKTKVVGMETVKGGIKVRMEGEGLAEADQSQVFSRVLVSIGRRPNSKIPGLDKTGVKVNERGFITVDAQMRTTAPNIFAIGDVVGEPMLAHKASHEARVAGRNRAWPQGRVRTAGDSPRFVYTDPELAWCGLTESEAKKAGPCGGSREVPVGRARPRARDRSAGRPDQAHHRPEDRTHPGRGRWPAPGPAN
jgi:dihydrolipoamide dehydrogenase